MPASETASRLTPYAREVLDNPEVQDQLRRGVERLRSACLRSRKRRIKAARDEKLRRQVREGVVALALAAKALASETQRPKRRWRRVTLVLGLGAAGAGVAVVLKGKSEGGQQ